MTEHYYTQQPGSAHDEWEIQATILGKTLTFITDAGTFSRDGLDKGTRALIEALPGLHGRVLDLGCGWGAVGVALAAADPGLEVVMTDINQRAAALARRNLTRNGTSALVVEGDGFEAVTGDFDAIVTNPPIRAGKTVIYGLFDEASRRLRGGGALYIVIRKQQGAPSALRHLQTRFGDVQVIDRSGGFWVLRAASPLEEGTDR